MGNFVELTRADRPVAETAWMDALVARIDDARDRRLDCRKPSPKVISLLSVGEQMRMIRERQITSRLPHYSLEDSIREALPAKSFQCADAKVKSTEVRRLERAHGDVKIFWVCHVGGEALDTERAVIREVIERSVGRTLKWPKNPIGFYLGKVDSSCQETDFDEYEDCLPEVIKVDPLSIDRAMLQTSSKVPELSS